jgi:hypothetical protein
VRDLVVLEGAVIPAPLEHLRHETLHAPAAAGRGGMEEDKARLLHRNVLFPQQASVKPPRYA